MVRSQKVVDQPEEWDTFVLALGHITPVLSTMDYYRRLQDKGYARPSYWFEVGSEPLLPLTFGQLIEWAAEEYADSEAMVSIYEKVRWTFKEAKEKV
ncbi:unnamed protein product, partial [Timema podura]|nr:unnamed protein product [Timema podura]